MSICSAFSLSASVSPVSPLALAYAAIFSASSAS